jgi:two-component system, cell cycle sensor histidine kinase and response regulator CckA
MEPGGTLQHTTRYHVSIDTPAEGTWPMNVAPADDLLSFAALFQNATDAMVITDDEGCCLAANSAAGVLIGVAPADMVGWQVAELVAPERAAESWREFLLRGKMRGRFRARRPDGSTAELEHESVANIAPGRHLSVIRDVSERRAAEESLRRLAAIIDSSEDAIYSWDLDGVIRSWNAGAEATYGYRADEAIGQSNELLAPPDREDELHGILAHIREGKRIQQLETVRVRKDGELIHVSLTISPIHETNGTIVGVALIARDITRRKLLENQLRQSQKLEALGRLAGGVAHDFNNLLTIITGYSDILLADLPPHDESYAMVYEIKQACERASSLTRQLLTFSRRQARSPIVLDPNQVVRQIDVMLRRLIGEDIELSPVLDPALRPVKVDQGELEQIIMNLAINARDAMPDGGRLTIETRNVTIDRRDALAGGGLSPGQYVLLSVRDTGHGMDHATLARIFEPFFTTKEVGKGTGLGLATVYGIVKQCGGHIAVTSAPRRGATFDVYLPVSSEPAATSPAERQEPSAPRGAESVLLVEDDPGIRRLAQHLLESHGYSVFVASNGYRALKLARTAGPNLALLVTDVVMPRMDGTQLAGQLTALYPSVRVLYLSGHTDDTLDRHALGRGGATFLRKPFTPSELLRKVREVLDTR